MGNADSKVIDEKERVEDINIVAQQEDSVVEGAVDNLAGGSVSQSRKAPGGFDVGRFSFKWSDAQLGLSDETGYTTATPPASVLALGRRRKDEIAYLPMLQFRR